MKLKIKAVSDKIGKDIPYPFYATARRHGSVRLRGRAGGGGPRALVSIPTGIAIALPSAEYVALVFARSGLGIKHGIALSNGVGVIDSDYRGDPGGADQPVRHPYTVQPGDRIAQLAVMPVVQAELERVDSLDDTGRGPAASAPPESKGRRSRPVRAAGTCRGGARPRPRAATRAAPTGQTQRTDAGRLDV
ncbi:dUTP diphosphatase [Flavonifractor plautii]|nr:dUTP diphosphatase [Flavonifractor plautii]